MSAFAHNPAHPVGTCADCGKEMVYNVPRMGPAGGYVHKDTGAVLCGPRTPIPMSTSSDTSSLIPRRAQLWNLSPAERAIYDAIQEVEEAGCHPLLTDAVVLLGQAKDKVADYVDNVEGQSATR